MGNELELIKQLKEELMLKNTFIAEYRLMQEYKRWYERYKKESKNE